VKLAISLAGGGVPETPVAGTRGCGGPRLSFPDAI